MRTRLVPTVVAATAAVVLGGVVVGVVAAPAGAADSTTLGQVGGTLVVCSAGPGSPPPFAALLGTEAAGQPTYTAPAAGVLTSFTHLANATGGQVRAVVFGPTAAGNRTTVYAKSPRLTVTPGVSNTFAVRVPMRAGDHLGIGTTTSGMACLRSGVAGDVSWLAPFDPDTRSDFVSSTNPGSVRPNISAVLEPDVDGDQYGDVTQDACPASALTQVACPAPDTTVTKRPKRFRANPKVKVKFTSTIAGSTFECSFDGRRYKTCKSPYQQVWGVGLHRLKIRAISPVGIVDPKPAKVRVEITR